MKNSIFLIFIIILFASCKKEDAAMKSLKSNYSFDPNPPFSIEFISGTKEEVMKPDKVWERRFLNYFNIIKTNGEWQMWYEAFDANAIHDDLSNLCYAYSKDGKEWIKPELPFYRINGQKSNILIKGSLNAGIHGPFVSKMSSGSRSYLMTALSFDLNKGNASSYGYTSEDGLIWKNKKLITADHLDTQNTFIEDNDKLVFYTRFWTGLNVSNGFRAIGKMVTDTSWNLLQANSILLTADPSTDFKHAYNNALSKVSDHLYLSFPSLYNDLTSEIRIAMAYGTTLDKLSFFNNDVTEEITEGADFKSIYVAPGVFETQVADTYWLYYFATDSKHGQYNSNNLSAYYRIKFRIKYK